jgi:heterodisulfide reductase subunit B
MSQPVLPDFSYFPGCSMASTAEESNLSMMKACKILGLNLIELEDWNCCGSSSAECLDKELSLALAARNLSLAPADRPLVAMCPRCLHKLRHTQLLLQKEPKARRRLEYRWGRAIPPNLEIIHFMEVLARTGMPRLEAGVVRSLKGLKFVPYYGCTLFRPPILSRRKYYQGEMENILTSLGAQALVGAYTNRCCGSFLSATNPEIVAPLVNEIVSSAVTVGAHCLVTACAMCQLNLEVRCTAEPKIPVFHFSEILALALGAEDYEDWFTRHLVDPRPMLQELALVA